MTMNDTHTHTHTHRYTQSQRGGEKGKEPTKDERKAQLSRGTTEDKKESEGNLTVTRFLLC